MMLKQHSDIQRVGHSKPCVPKTRIKLFLDRDRYKAGETEINVVAVRFKEHEQFVVSARVCIHCFAQKCEYRKRIREFLRHALSDELISNPELQKLLFMESEGTA